jgi:hypothetical protein
VTAVRDHALFYYIFTILYFMLLIVSVYIDHILLFIANMTGVTYILPQHDPALLSRIMMFFLIHILYCHSPYIYLLYDFIVFRLVSYHIDAEVTQKGI